MPRDRCKRKSKDISTISQRSFRRRIVQEIVGSDDDESTVNPNCNITPKDNINDISDNNCNPNIINCPSNSNSTSSFFCDSEESDDLIDFHTNDTDSSSNESDTDDCDILLNVPEICDNESQFKDELIFWAVMNKIKHNALDDLLVILRKQTCGQNLPKTARTLLSTPRNSLIRSVNPGYYCHFGIRSGLTEVLEVEQNKIKDFNISINISTDGLPLSNSSTSELWPIMGSIVHSSVVFLIGVYHGYSKPENANEFLQEFFVEITDLINNGFIYKQTLYSISINCITCDTPARSFITMTKGHAGYYSCSKCCQEGEYIDHRMCFPNITNNVLRTDNCFINQEYDDYQLGRSILNDIPNFKPVSLIPLDYMHLVCIGVMRKIMALWLGGKPASKIVRLPLNKIKMISQNLLDIRNVIPNDFARRPQRIEKLGSWKATELRQFLLYTAPVILYNILNPQVYSHVISFHVAMRILSNKTLLENYADYAQSLLEHFVDTFIILYGKRYVSHNVHGLIHIVNDAKLLGPIHEFSTFQFENYLRILKMQLRKSDKPLQQIHRRYKEKAFLNSHMPKIKNNSTGAFLRNHWNGPILNTTDVNKQFKDAKIKNSTLSSEYPNNICITYHREVFIVHNFVYDKHLKCMVVLGKTFLNKGEIYETPCKSSLLDCYLVSDISENIQSCLVSDIMCKCIALPWKHDSSNSLAVFPLLDSDYTKTN